MKNVLLIILIFILMLFLIACENTTNQSMPEAIGESENDASYSNTQSSGSVNESSEKIILNWPKDKLPSSVPELKDITITSITDIENGIELAFTGCNEDETKAYTVSLTRAGWDFETENNDLGKTVYATRQNESLIFFSPIYDDSNDIGTITYTKTN